MLGANLGGYVEKCEPVREQVPCHNPECPGHGEICFLALAKYSSSSRLDHLQC